MRVKREVGEFYPAGQWIDRRGVEYQTIKRNTPGNDRFILKDTKTSAGSQQAAHNLTPTLVHKLYFYGALGPAHEADKRMRAAELLQEKFYEGGLSQKLGGSYERVEPSESEPTDAEENARRIWNEAKEAIKLRYRNTTIMAVNYDQQPCDMSHLLLGLDCLVEFWNKRG